MERSIKVLVVNGSPKGDYSLTLQHSLYMLGQEKEVEYRILQAGEALSDMNYDHAWLKHDGKAHRLSRSGPAQGITECAAIPGG